MKRNAVEARHMPALILLDDEFQRARMNPARRI
jgi:hypothetical protein